MLRCKLYEFGYCACKNIFNSNFFGNDSRRTDRDINSITFQNLLCITFVNNRM